MCAGVLLGVFVPSAQASCVGPMIAVGTEIDTTSPPTISPPTIGTVRLGRSLTVTGRFFHTGCADTYSTTGCSGTPTPNDPEATMTGVALVLIQDERSWTLDTRDASDAGGLYSITWHATLPDAVRPGQAVLMAASATLKVVVTR